MTPKEKAIKEYERRLNDMTSVMKMDFSATISRALEQQAKEIFDELEEIGEEYSDVDNLHCLSIQISKLLKLKAKFKEETNDT